MYYINANILANASLLVEILKMTTIIQQEMQTIEVILGEGELHRAFCDAIFDTD